MVYKGKGVPTLANVHQNPRGMPEPSKETDRRSSTGGDLRAAAGKPTYFDGAMHTIPTQPLAGRRSRRNSFSEESQLTVENFGGSSENLQMIGRNPDKEMVVSGRRTVERPAIHRRKSELESSIDLGSDVPEYNRKSEDYVLKREDLAQTMPAGLSDRTSRSRDTSPFSRRSLVPSDELSTSPYAAPQGPSSPHSTSSDSSGGVRATSFAELVQSPSHQGVISINYQDSNIKGIRRHNSQKRTPVAWSEPARGGYLSTCLFSFPACLTLLCSAKNYCIISSIYFFLAAQVMSWKVSLWDPAKAQHS